MWFHNILFFVVENWKFLSKILRNKKLSTKIFWMGATGTICHI